MHSMAVTNKLIVLLQINTWLEELMSERSEDLYRTKGVLSIDGWEERFVFQVCLSVCKTL